MTIPISEDLPPPARPDSEAVRRRLEHERRDRIAQLKALLEDEETASDEIMGVQQTSARRVIEEIDAALERLDAGEYGTCPRCGEPIPAERLEILPYARHCVRCRQRSR